MNARRRDPRKREKKTKKVRTCWEIKRSILTYSLLLSEVLLVSSLTTGTITENMFSFVNHLIKDLPVTFVSFIMNTNHYLTILSQLDIPEKAILVALV